MVKARSRTAARKVKDRWKAKSWYNILAPPAFDSVTIADTLADNPASLINRVTEVSVQDLTNDFRRSHIKLYFKIYKVEETNAHTQFVGHSLTSDYLRRMVRRKRSKIDGVYDATTRDGATIRVKPFATTDKRIQNSQRKIVRETMKKTIYDKAKNSTLSEFVKNIIDGKIGSDIYKNCKKLYPVKRVEIYKTQVLSPPTIEIEEEKPEETTKEQEIKETKEKETPEKEEKTPKEPEILEKPANEEPVETEEEKEVEPTKQPESEENKIKEKLPAEEEPEILEKPLNEEPVEAEEEKEVEPIKQPESEEAGRKENKGEKQDKETVE